MKTILGVLLALLYLGYDLGVTKGLLVIPAATRTKYETFLTEFDNRRGHVPGYPDFDANRKKVALFLKSKFEAAGLTVYLDNFTSTETNTREAVNGTNVIAVLPGTSYKTPQDEVILLAAHIDTYGLKAGGVNNDGTGLVGLLAIAQDLAGPEKCPMNNTVVFAAFDRSETVDIGLDRTYCNKSCGSIEFLRNKATFIGSGKIKLAIVMDCISNFDVTTGAQEFTQPLKDYFKKETRENEWTGYWGDFLAISGRSNEEIYLDDFKKIYEISKGDFAFDVIKFQWDVQGVPNAQNRSNMIGGFKDGDQMSFWDANINAILLTDTCYNRGYMRSCKTDENCDKLNKLNSKRYNFMYSAVYSAMNLTKRLICQGACSSCDPYADCNNGVCTCKTGFTGNGYLCSDIDECRSKPCGSNAGCSNVPGSYKCTCNKGYTGNGVRCTDIDECQSKPCGSYASCSNEPGSYKCTCNKGYNGNGFNCTVKTAGSLVLPQKLLISLLIVLSLILFFTQHTNL